MLYFRHIRHFTQFSYCILLVLLPNIVEHRLHVCPEVGGNSTAANTTHTISCYISIYQCFYSTTCPWKNISTITFCPIEEPRTNWLTLCIHFAPLIYKSVQASAIPMSVPRILLHLLSLVNICHRLLWHNKRI